MTHPLPAVVARADTAIEDCVELMKEKSVGSILVVSDDTAQSLVGIFTERDLVRRLKQIVTGDHWKRAIRTVMTRPLVTVDVSELELAPELMMKHGFRHIPVTLGQGASRRLAGIVGMRDFFIHWMITKDEGGKKPGVSDPQKSTKVPVSVHATGRDKNLLELIRKVIAMAGGGSSVQVTLGDLDTGRPLPEGAQVVLLDIDWMEARAWTKMLRNLEAKKPALRIAIVYDPARLSQASDRHLRSVGEGPTLLSKPVNVIALPKFLGCDLARAIAAQR